MNLSPHEPARLTADRMGERWRTADVRAARDFAGGMHANLLPNMPGETAGPPTDAAILILVLRGERQHTLWHDGRTTVDGVLPSGGLTIIPAGVSPRAVVENTIRVLHLYLPGSVLETLAEEHYSHTGPVTLIDPLFGDDSLLYGPMAMLARALDGREPPNRLWLDGIGTAICGRALDRWSSLSNRRTAASTALGGSHRDWRIRRAIDYLELRIS